MTEKSRHRVHTFILWKAFVAYTIKFWLQNCDNLLVNSVATNIGKRRLLKQDEIRELALTTHDILYRTLIPLQQPHVNGGFH